MKLVYTYSADQLNGVGLREVLFFSGCDFRCPGCFNAELQDPDYSTPGSHEWGESDYQDLLKRLSHSYISGVTILGGDGFSECNKAGVLELCKRLREDMPEKTIWIYTGYTFEQIKKMKDERWECLKYIDVLCDGPFIESRLSPKLPWVGSDNQRVIDMVKTLKSGKLVLWAM